MGTRRVLVTGCSSGIGLAVAVRLAKDELRRFEGETSPPFYKSHDTQQMTLLEASQALTLGVFVHLR